MSIADTRTRLEELDHLYETLREFSATFEPKDFSGEEAERIVKRGEAIRRLGMSIKLQATARVEDTGHYKRRGDRNAGQWLANQTGEREGTSRAELEALKASERHPVLNNAVRNGEVPVERANQIATAADQCPETAKELVEKSKKQNHDEFKKTCDLAANASRSAEDEMQRHERLRRARQCRTWTDQDGFGCLYAKLAPDGFAVLKANLERIESDVFDRARKDGAHESRQAYMADALVEMAKASGSPEPEGSDGTAKSATTRTLVRIRVDLDALIRGYAEAGETCEIPGVGRVSVAIARAVLGDALLELVITNGIDVSTVITDSRYIRKALNLALEERDPTCVVPGCNATDFLERDHWQTDFAKKGKTAIFNLARLCVFHHRQRTHGGWVLSGGPGNWTFEEVYVRTPGSSEFEDDPPDQETDPPEPTKLF